MPMVDMAMDDEQIQDMATPIAMKPEDRPSYPYGLCITLTDADLAKLGLSADDVEVGGYFHFQAVACVTSYSKTEREGDDGPCCRIEAQIEKMDVTTTDDEQDGPEGY